MRGKGMPQHAMPNQKWIQLPKIPIPENPEPADFLQIGVNRTIPAPVAVKCGRVEVSASTHGWASTRNKLGALFVRAGRVNPVVKPEARSQSEKGDQLLAFVLPRMR